MADGRPARLLPSPEHAHIIRSTSYIFGALHNRLKEALGIPLFALLITDEGEALPPAGTT
jgi:hypothetical protein